MKSNANTHEGEKQQSSHLYREIKINVINRVKWKVLSDLTAQMSKMKTKTHWYPGSLMWFWGKSTISVWLSLLHKLPITTTPPNKILYFILSNYCFIVQGLMSLGRQDTLHLYMSEAHRHHLWPGDSTIAPHCTHGWTQSTLPALYHEKMVHIKQCLTWVEWVKETPTQTHTNTRRLCSSTVEIKWSEVD